MSETKTAETSDDCYATIRLKMEENSQAESASANQMKGKRRSKLKMPLKKIPKRKQNSLTEQINMCQDFANLDLPDNLSALIVSSLHGPGEPRPCHHQPRPNQNTARTPSPCMSYESVDRQKKLIHPPPPLVSISRSSMMKQSSSFPPVPTNMSPLTTVGGNEPFDKRKNLVSSSPTMVRNDYQTAISTNSSNIPSENMMKTVGVHQLAPGGFEKNTPKTLNRSANTSCEFMRTGEPDHFYMQASKQPDMGGSVKVMRQIHTEPNVKFLKQINRYDVADMIKSKPYKQYHPDMGLPLVQVKPPILTPISPEKKKTQGKRSLLTMKKNQGEGNSGPSPRGRKPSEKNQKNKENCGYIERKPPSNKKDGPKWCPDVTYNLGEDTEDDDVIITGVFNLNDLHREHQTPFTNPKSGANYARRNTKFVETDLRSRFNIEKYCYENAKNVSTNQTNKKKPASKRGAYTRKITKSAYTRDETFTQDGDMRTNKGILYCCEHTKQGIRCNLKNENTPIRNDAVPKNLKELSKEAVRTDEITQSYSLSQTCQQEIDERQRDEHFTNIINAIKKEDDLRSSMNKKVNSSIKDIRETGAVDWRSWLNTDNPTKMDVEIGSGTDSGNDDDLVLRDLSEFLLLSEDRRYSRRNLEGNENSSVREVHLSRKIFNDNFNFDGTNINFDNIDSSVNFINSIDMDSTTLKKQDGKLKTADAESVNFEEDKYYSNWQSYFDNLPKYPIQKRYQNRSVTFWKRFLLSERNPFLDDTDHYQFRTLVLDKNKRLEESATKAGCILRSESADRGIAPSYESKFYKKRIYRKKNKASQDSENVW